MEGVQAEIRLITFNPDQLYLLPSPVIKLSYPTTSLTVVSADRMSLK